MICAHAFWTAPAKERRDPIEPTQLEFATWLLSAATFKARNPESRLWLYTDPTGRVFAEKAGILTAYDQIKLWSDFAIPGVNPNIFWAAAKVQAIAQTPAPCAVMDLDFVLNRRLHIYAYCAAALEEKVYWTNYTDNEKQYGRYGLRNFGTVNHKTNFWSAIPYNCGVLGFRDHETKTFYTSTSLSFMERFTEQSTTISDPANYQQDRDNAMMFAEQRLLGMCMAKMDHRINTLGKLRGRLPLGDFDGKAWHLWTAKDIYRKAPRFLRENALNFVVRRIEKEFPKYKWILEWGMPDDCGFAQILAEDEPDHDLTRTISRIRGKVQIWDPVFPIARTAEDGCKLYLGEYLDCSGGSCIVSKNNEILLDLKDSRPWPDFRSDVVWTGVTSNLGTI